MSVRVVVADDSELYREVLREALEADGDIRVVGEAGDGAEAVQLAERANADLVTLDLQMPGLGGLEAIEELMARRPVPILVLTSKPAGPGSQLIFEATRRGALDILEKRVVSADGGAQLREQVRQLSSVRVVRHPRPAPRQPEAAEAGAADLEPVRWRRVVGIGASAGGPPAVAAVLARLPASFPACIAVVQHLSAGFAQSYVRFLQDATALKVELCEGPGPALPGTVLVAADGHHLVAAPGRRFALSQAPPDHGHRPSVDALFSSLATEYASGAVGVVLSGMGADGACGIERLVAAGGLALAQDEASSIIFGMPRAAAAVPGTRVLGLEEIAALLERATAGAAP